MSNNDAAFLGTGWSFPPVFTEGGAEVEMVSGAEDIEQSLKILLWTHLGERTMQEEYGLSGFLFEEMDQGLVNSLRRLISDGILYHEPRIKLDKVDVSDSGALEGLLLISITYTVRTITLTLRFSKKHFGDAPVAKALDGPVPFCFFLSTEEKMHKVAAQDIVHDGFEVKKDEEERSPFVQHPPSERSGAADSDPGYRYRHPHALAGLANLAEGLRRADGQRPTATPYQEV